MPHDRRGGGAAGNVRWRWIDTRASTVHWRFADVSGRQVVLEIVDRHAVFYENELGVLTNSPGFEWQLTNLNNYVNLYPGSAPERRMEGVRLAAFGAGSGCWGCRATSRRRRGSSVRRSTRRPLRNGRRPSTPCCNVSRYSTISIFRSGWSSRRASFRPIFRAPRSGPRRRILPGRTIYYRTMYDSTIRSIDLRAIDFGQVRYRSEPLDEVRRQPVVPVRIG